MLGFSLTVCVLWCEEWKEVWRSGGPHNTCFTWRKWWRRKTCNVCTAQSKLAEEEEEKNRHSGHKHTIFKFSVCKMNRVEGRAPIQFDGHVLLCVCPWVWKAHRPTFWLPDWMSSLHSEFFLFLLCCVAWF